MGGQADQRLARRRGERQGLGRGGASQRGVSRRPVIARPGQSPIGLAEDALAPGQPAIVRLQPGPSPRQVARVEAEVGREALQEEPFLVDEVAGLGGGSGGKERADPPPGGLRIAPVPGNRGVRPADLAPQTGVAGRRQVLQDRERLLPATVEDEAAQPGNPGGDARRERATGPAEGRLGLGRVATPEGRIGRDERVDPVPQLVAEREGDQDVMTEVAEDRTAARPGLSRVVGPAQRGIGDAEPVIGERGGIAGWFRHPRARREDGEEPLAAGNRVARPSGQREEPDGNAALAVESRALEPRHGELVVGRRGRDRSRERSDACDPRCIVEPRTASRCNASSASMPSTIAARPSRSRSE